MQEQDKVNELIKYIYEYIGAPVDYAELIDSPVPSSYGIYYTYEDPGDILLSQAAEMLQEQQNKINELLGQLVHATWYEGNGWLDYANDDFDNAIVRPTYICSNCKSEEDYSSDYCPNCGARMDLEE